MSSENYPNWQESANEEDKKIISDLRSKISSKRIELYRLELQIAEMEAPVYFMEFLNSKSGHASQEQDDEARKLQVLVATYHNLDFEIQILIKKLDAQKNIARLRKCSSTC